MLRGSSFFYMSEKLFSHDSEVDAFIRRVEDAGRAAQQHAQDVESVLDAEKMREIQALTPEEVGKRFRESAEQSMSFRDDIQRLQVMRVAFRDSIDSLSRRLSDACRDGHDPDFSADELALSESMALTQHSAIVSAQKNLNQKICELDRETGACLMVPSGKRVSLAAEA